MSASHAGEGPRTAGAPCTEFETILLDRAAGLLDADGEARLLAHLPACAACRAEDESLRRALALVALPPPSEAERAAVRDGARGAVVRMAGERRWRRAAGLLAVAASVALAIGVPGALRATRTPAAPPPVAAAWSLPDIDAAWAAAGAAFPAAADEAEPVVFFAELQEVDLDLE